MIVRIYITMMPLILGGVFNMVFTKTEFYKNHKKPIDKGKNFIDNKRVFGDNKTIIGFISMTILCCIFQIICGIIYKALNIEQLSDLYTIYENTFLFNAIYGLATGFIYMLYELPNSFLKRRLNIKPGKTETGKLGALFFIIDQVDSLIPVMFMLYIISDITFFNYCVYVFIGAFTHIAINYILYFLKVRKNL